MIIMIPEYQKRRMWSGKNESSWPGWGSYVRRHEPGIYSRELVDQIFIEAA